MRTFLGWVVLIAGVVVLGLWARSNHAMDIEAKITEAAAKTGSIHKIQLSVSGRDITVEGLADSEAERDTIIASLNGVDGRRVVNDGLKILEKADPYLFKGQKNQDGVNFEGNIPVASAGTELKKYLGAPDAKLTLASGMPEGKWLDFVLSSATALKVLNEGEFAISGKNVTLRGVAATPAEEAKARAALARLAEGYSADINIKVLDDGRPANVSVQYDAAKGASLAGKAPAGVSSQDLAGALGLKTVSGEATASGQSGGDAIKAKLAKLAAWLPFFESFKASVSEDKIAVDGVLGKGADEELIAGQLREQLGAGADIALSQSQASVTDGTERANAATGQKQVFRNGYWLPARDFIVSKDECAANTDGIMKGATINFVTGSDRLGPRAVRVINQLAATLSHCLAGRVLSVEVGGHTDSQGNDDANMDLSVRRASAVLSALADRGVPQDLMTAKGYGETLPVADNNTAEGRAQNRRTTFIWFEN